MIEIKTDIDRSYMDELERKLDGNLQRASDYFSAIVASNAPVKTGKLKTGIRTKKLTGKNKGYKLDAEFYLFFYEYGTLDQSGKEHQTARPFVNPLLAQYDEQLTRIITEGL